MADISKNIVDDLRQRFSLQQDHGRIGVAGEFEIDVLTQERFGRRFDAPEKPTEAGYDITDNTSARPITLAIQISSNRWNWRDQRRALEYMADGKIAVQYYSPIDKKVYKNMIIESLDFSANVNQSTGFTADLKLKQLRIVSASQATFEVVADAQGTVPQTDVPITSEGVLKPDNMEGQAFDTNGILWNFNNRGVVK